MNIDQLKALHEIAQTGSVSAASRKLFLTQPAVSQKIKALEESCGQQLLERIGSRVQLSQAGNLLLTHARIILNQIELAQHELEQLSGLEHGELVIACSDTVARYLLLESLATFSKKHSRVEIQLKDLTSKEVIQSVEKFEADIGFAMLPLNSNKLNVANYFSYKEVLACSKEHVLAKKSRIHLKTLEKYKLLLLEESTRSAELLAQDFVATGTSIQSKMALSSVEAQKEFARIDFGLAIVPDFALSRDRSDPDLKSLKITGLRERRLGLLTAKGRNLSAASQAFIGELKHLKLKKFVK